MHLWVDDLRPPPDGWFLAQTVEEALRVLGTGRVTFVSLDHDLGPGGEGWQIANYIEEGAHLGWLPRLQWRIHSANPVGRARMTAALESADRAWRAR